MEDTHGVVEKLLALVEVVEAGGFSAASLRTGIPASRLSRSIAALERELGVNLLLRNSRHFKVTELGQRMALHAATIRVEVHQALALARDSLGEPAGPLRVSCPIVLASELVGPLAMEFVRTYPRVALTLDSTDERPTVGGEPVDLVIQPSREGLQDSDRIAKKLADIRYVVVASPALLNTLGRPTEPQQLRHAPAIGWTFQPRPSRWRLVNGKGAEVEIDVAPRFTSDNLLQIVEAVREGIGIAQLPSAMLQADLAAGRLCLVAPDWTPPPVSLWVLYPARNALTRAGRAFLEMLSQRVERTMAQSQR